MKERLGILFYGLILSISQNAKSRNLPEYGRIPAFDLLAALDKMHYVNFY